MLVLARKRGERIIVECLDEDGNPNGAEMTISLERGMQVRLGFFADPKQFRISREEIVGKPLPGESS